MCGGGDDIYKPEFKQEVINEILRRDKIYGNREEIKITIKKDEKRED